MAPWRGRLGTVPIRWRLWALYVALLVLVLVGLGVALDRFVHQLVVGSAVDHAELQAIRTIDRELGVGGAEPKPAPKPPRPGDPAPPSDLERTARALVRELSARDVQVAVYGPDGKVVVAGEAPSDVALPPPPDPRSLERALGGAESSRVLPDRSPRQALALVPIRDGSGNVRGAVALVVSLEAADSVLGVIQIALGLGALAAALLGAVVGVPATGALLRPLDRIVAIADRVAAGDLARRVGLGDRGDELGRVGAALDRMLDRLQAAMEAQRRFVADASHELKSPLTGLDGMLELLWSTGDDDPARPTALNAIGREVDRMQRLVADLLTLSRLDAQPAGARTQVDLAALLEEQVEARALAGGPPIGLVLEARPLVSGDADGLARLVRNLIDNAVAATAAGGGIAVRLAADDRSIDLEVADDGVGIAAEALPHLFERFYRVDFARGRRAGGTGLGLSVAQSIAHAHGGSIDARSEGPGRGAVFTLRLPLEATQ